MLAGLLHGVVPCAAFNTIASSCVWVGVLATVQS